MKNSILIESLLKALYTVVGSHTSNLIAYETIESSIKTMENKYDFLKKIKIGKIKNFLQNDFEVSFSLKINKVNPELIGKAIEAIIRMVYNDVRNDVGLYFIIELKEHTGE